MVVGVIILTLFTKDEREKYEEHLKWLWIKASALVKKYQEGVEIGKSEDIEIGQKNQSIKTANNLLALRSLTIEQISAATGLVYC